MSVIELHGLIHARADALAAHVGHLMQVTVSASNGGAVGRGGPRALFGVLVGVATRDDDGETTVLEAVIHQPDEHLITVGVSRIKQIECARHRRELPWQEET